MDWSTICFITAIIIVGIVFLIFVSAGKHGHKFDIEFYQSRILSIEQNLQKTSPSTFAMTIVEGDKLLDKAMVEMGLPGKTMGERLKKSGNRFSELNSVWRAHKLRNFIAHESGFEVSYTQAKNALAIYQQALKDLGAI